MTVEEAKTVPMETLVLELNRLFPSKAKFQLWEELSKVYESRQLEGLKQCAISNLLDGANEDTKLRVTPLLMLLPLSTLVDANPYKNYDTSDCHTHS